MFYLLQTIALLSAIGIVLPIAIHLWNKREGKILKLGSVQLLAETAHQQARSLRLKDLLLLLLRCGIIILIALLLAKPIWQKQLNAKDRKGWLVLESSPGEASHNFKPLIDSLQLAGFETHLFTAGFPMLNLKDTGSLKNPTDSLPYWALLKELNEQVPDDLPVYLITDNRLNRFSGNRPAVAMNLNWLVYPSVDTTTGNAVATRLLANDSIEIILAHSSATYTAYVSKQIANTYTSQTNLGSPDVATNLAMIDTGILRIGILKDPSGMEAGYLEAALNAVRQYGQYRMNLEVTTDPNKLTATYDWVFWLAEKEPPAAMKTTHVFKYEAGKEKPVFSWLENSFTNGGNGNKIQVTKSVEGNEKAAGETIWSNGYGEPVLSKQKGKKTVYRFYSRFNPAWTDLVWSETFPQLLFDLMLKETRKTNLKDNRVIDIQQMQPERTTTGSAAIKPHFLQTTDLSKWAWGSACLLFLLERVISLQTKKELYA